MNLRAILLCGALSVATLPAADTLTGEFQRALFEEEANRNLPAAIAGYEAVVKRLDEQRQLAATAVFRLGESYRKLGKTNEAVSAYERIIREFADQETLVKLSGQNLSILRPARTMPATLDASAPGPATPVDLAELRRLEILLETVRSLEPMSEAELRTLLEFANDENAAAFLQSLRNARRQLGHAEEKLRGQPENKVAESQARQWQSMVGDSEEFLSEWRATTLRMLEARVEAARRLAGREPSEAQFSAASQLDPATRARQKEILEAEILLVGRQLSEVNQEVEAGTLSSVTLLPGMLDLHRLRRELAAFEGGPDAKANQLRHAEKEVTLMDQLISAKSEQVESGQAPSSELIQLERQKLSLQREIIRLNSRMEASASSSPVTETMTAEEAEELRRVQALAANSPDLINKGDKDRVLPLQRAIENGHLNVVRYLLANGADPSFSGNSRRTAIYLAAERGQLAALRLLLDTGVSVNETIDDGRTALHTATESGNDAVIEFLLDNGADVNAQDNSGQTSLHIAAAKGLTNLIELLVTGGASLEISGQYRASPPVRGAVRYGGTPLCFAVENNQDDAVELLLAKGASPNPDTKVSSPLWLAVKVGNTNFVHRLIRAGSVTTNEPLIELAIERMPAMIPFLLEAGANPNLVSNDRSSPPLHRATGLFSDQWRRKQSQAQGSSPTVGRRQQGASARGGTGAQLMPVLPPSAMSPRALTPHEQEVLNEVNRNVINQTIHEGLVDSGSEGDPDWAGIVKSMIEHGADVNAVHGGRSILALLGAQPDFTPMEMFGWLLEKGADPNLGGWVTDSGVNIPTPLNGACRAGNVELAKLLIKHGAKLEGREEGDRWTTPLRVAVDMKHVEMVKLLLENGANPNVVGADEQTPLMGLLDKYIVPGGHGMSGPFGSVKDGQFYSSSSNIPELELAILEITRLLLGKGGRLNAELTDGFMPVHFAAAAKDGRFLELFLEFRADSNATNAFGVTPLHTAATKNQSENIRLLVQAGADVNLADHNGDTPLHIAAMLNRVQASEVLLELGADRERKNRFGRNPVENLLNDVKVNKRPPFGLPEYLDPIKNVTDVLGR